LEGIRFRNLNSNSGQRRCSLAIGPVFQLEINQVVMLGFVISLSSTAVIVKLLKERNELYTKTGKNVIGVLLAQDVLIVPMIIILGYLGGDKQDINLLLKQIIGGILIVGVIIYVLVKKEIRLPFHEIPR
jgi:CPA2 family monovalent cation:H+ antiporter-2